MRPADLTPRQWEVLRFILKEWKGGSIPTFREIADRFGMAGFTGVTCHTKVLRRKGYLRDTKGGCIALTRKAIALTRKPAKVQKERA